MQVAIADTGETEFEKARSFMHDNDYNAHDCFFLLRMLELRALTSGLGVEQRKMSICYR